MKSKTSKKSIVFRSFLLLPLLAILLAGFTESKMVTIVKENQIVKKRTRIYEDIQILINNKGELLVKDQIVLIKDLASFLSQLNGHLSKEERMSSVRAIIIPQKSAPKTVIDEVDKILMDHGVAQINIVGPETLPQSPVQVGATKEQMKEYNTLAKKYNAIDIEQRKIPLFELTVLELAYQNMNTKQRKLAQPFPECLPQEGAMKVQLQEYNSLAKRYNTMIEDEDNIRIRKSDVDRLEYLHGLMTEEQKANAEPFPDFPEPPPPPSPPSPPDKGEKEMAEEVIQDIITNQDPHDGLVISTKPTLLKNPQKNTSSLNYQKLERSNAIPIGAFNVPRGSVRVTASGRQLQEGIDYTVNYQAGTVQILDPSLEATNTPIKISVEKNAVKSDVSIKAPPSPPEPKSLLDHVIEMSKKDATFHYEGKEITSDKAIEILKKNESINIETKHINDKHPVVRLSMEPIVIEN